MKKLIAIFLTLLMLSSSTGLALGTHYCGGKAVKTQLVIGHANIDCGMVKMSTACKSEESKHDKQLQRKPCCENQYASIDTDNTLVNKILINSVDLSFLISLTFTSLGIDLFYSDQNIAFSYYYPPILKRNSQVLFQSFLI